jgi:hypothetical protein
MYLAARCSYWLRSETLNRNGDKAGPGNQGFLDQLEGLRWVSVTCDCHLRVSPPVCSKGSTSTAAHRCRCRWYLQVQRNAKNFGAVDNARITIFGERHAR